MHAVIWRFARMSIARGAVATLLAVGAIAALVASDAQAQSAQASGPGTAASPSKTQVWVGQAAVEVECEAGRPAPHTNTAGLQLVGLGTELWVLIVDTADVLVFPGRNATRRRTYADQGALLLSVEAPDSSALERQLQLDWRVQGCRRTLQALLRQVEPAPPELARSVLIADLMRDVSRASELSKAGKAKEAIDLLNRTVSRSTELLGPRHRATLHARKALIGAIEFDADYAAAQRVALDLADDIAAAYGDDDPARLSTLVSVARLDVDRGELDSGVRRYELLLPQMRAVFGGEHRHYCQATFDAGFLFRQIGAFRRALAANQEAVSCLIATDGQFARGVLGMQTEQAFVLYKLGATGDALKLALETYRVQLERFGPRDRGSIINLDNIAGYYLELGRIEEAVETQRRAQALYEEVYGVDHPYTLLPLGNLVNVLRTAGRDEEALPLAERAYRLHAKAYGESHTTTLFNRHWYAVALGRTGQWTAALAEHEAVLQARRAQFGPEDIHVLDSRRSVANARMRLGDPGAAQLELADVCPLHERLEGRAHHATLECWRELGTALAALGRDAEAVDQLELYVTAAEEQRSVQAATAESRQAFLSLHAMTYKRLALMYARAGRPNDALRVAELVKGRTLLDALITQRADELAPLTSAERAELRELEERLAQLDAKMTEARADPPLRLSIDAQRQQAVESLRALRAQLRTSYPQYEQMDVARRVDAGMAARYLPPNTVFVSYVLADAELLVLTVDSRARIRTRSLDAKAVRSAVEAFRASLSPEAATRVWQRGDRTFVVDFTAPEGGVPVTSIDVPLKVLADHLVAPIEDLTDGKTAWIVAADEALAVLPFELLPRSQGRLVDAVNVSYVQSLAVHVRLAERGLAYQKQMRPFDLLSVGAVDYGTIRTSDTTVSLQRRSLASSDASSRAARQSVPEWVRSSGAIWSPLPASALEVRQVSALFGRSLTLTGSAASEARLAAMNTSGELAQVRLLHFATHGYVDTYEPMLSAIVLAQPPDGVFDGYLTAREWLDYRLQSDLTVLSACETALGGLVAGEGVLGLPYALFVAGNRNTILSLWKVPDASAAEFMVRFFRRVKAGQSQSAALAQTKREFMREARWRNPLNWAGFVLYGS